MRRQRGGQHKNGQVLEWLRNQLEAEGNDLLGEMVRSFAQGLMSAEADVVCGAGWGQQSSDRVNRRNGCRTRRWDTRVGLIELWTPEAAEGFVLPEVVAGCAYAIGAGVRAGGHGGLCAGDLDS